MKKIIYSFLIAFLIFPNIIFAESYTIKDLTLSFDNSTWYVLTRDNIYGNSALNKLGLSYSDLYNFMITNDIYLDAVKLDLTNVENSVELFISSKEVGKVKNLHTYNNKQLNELASKLKQKVGTDSYDIYTTVNYKYIHFNYYDLKYNIDTYYTVINGYGYTILIQKQSKLSSSEINEFKNIINSINFKNDDEYENNSESNTSNVIGEALSMAIVAAIIGGVSMLSSKNNKAEKHKK